MESFTTDLLLYESHNNTDEFLNSWFHIHFYNTSSNLQMLHYICS